MIDTVIHNDCLTVLRGMADNSVDAIVSDPPAGISFMGKDWDNFSGKEKTYDSSGARAAANADKEKLKAIGQGATPFGFSSSSGQPTRKERDAFVAFMTEVMSECLRVIRPGGHALIWALPRTSHWTATALEDAGFEVRDKLYHLFGSGFPKSLDISKAIDKMNGAEREVIGPKMRPDGKRMIDARPNGFDGSHEGWDRPWKHDRDAIEMQASITAPATPEAQRWQGYGTALKPSCEEWVLCRKPLAESSIAAQVLATGTGGINIGATRISHNEPQKTTERTAPRYSGNTMNNGVRGGVQSTVASANPQGRFPSHLLLSHSLWCVPRGMKRVRGDHKRGQLATASGANPGMFGLGVQGQSHDRYADSDGMETVEAYECWQGGPINAVCYEHKSCALLPSVEPSHLLDHVASLLVDLDSYSMNDNSLLSSEAVLSHTACISQEDASGDLLHEVACALGVSQFVSSLFDCPSCLRLCGEYVHRLAMASQDGLPSLVDALSLVYRQLVSLVHNQHYQDSVSPLAGVDKTQHKHQSRNVSDDARYTRTSHELQSHRQDTLFEALPPVDQHDSTLQSNTCEPCNDEKLDCNAHISEVVKLLCWMYFDLAYRLLPPGIIAQNRIDSNTSICPIAELDRQSGVRKSGFMRAGTFRKEQSMYGQGSGYAVEKDTYGDTGGSSRYFQHFPPDDYTPYLYQAKASRAERNRGCEDLPEQHNGNVSQFMTGTNSNWIEDKRSSNGGYELAPAKPQSNHHPTVKSTSLMRWLIRLITPPDGIVLDPFCGSGSTCVAAIHEGKHFIGIEQDESYVNIANARIEYARTHEPDVVQVATKKVKGGGHWTHKREIGDGNIYHGGGREEVDFGTRSMEEVEDWECAPDCPVRILGEQSGYHRNGGSGKHHEAKSHDGATTTFRSSHTGMDISDQGTAARYFQQFAPDLWTQDMQDAEEVFIAEGGYEGEVSA